MSLCLADYETRYLKYTDRSRSFSPKGAFIVVSFSLITYGGSSKVIGVIIGMGTEERKVAMTILRLLSM